MNITKGKQNGPIRAVIYGPEGIGKSTLASQWPKPLFVDAENGTTRLEVDRIAPLSWGAVKAAVTELTEDAGGYQTIVFDTADWLERMAMQAVCAEHNWASIETPGYGKGFTMLAEEWKRFLDSVALMQAKQGVHVVMLAHAAMRKFEQPDETGSYDRWELKLSKQVSPAMKEWADLVLFLNYRTIVVQQENGKAKAQGGQRVMFTTHHPCWDAKNRFDLKEEMPLAFDGLASMFAAPITAETATEPETKPAIPAPEPKPEPPPVDPEKLPLLRQLKQLLTDSNVTTDELVGELARKGVVPAGTNPRDFNLATLNRVIAGWSAITHNIAVHKQA